MKAHLCSFEKMQFIKNSSCTQKHLSTNLDAVLIFLFYSALLTVTFT